MQIFAKYELQETITDREKVMEVRQVGGRQLQQIMQSGKFSKCCVCGPQRCS